MRLPRLHGCCVRCTDRRRRCDAVRHGEPPSRRLPRRRTLMPHGRYHLGRSETPRSPSYDRGRFGRLFPALPPFAEDTQPVRDALAALGAPDGPMNAGDDLSDPLTLITDPAKSANRPQQPGPHRRLHVPGPVHRPRHDVRPPRRVWRAGRIRESRARGYALKEGTPSELTGALHDRRRGAARTSTRGCGPRCSRARRRSGCPRFPSASARSWTCSHRG